MPIVGMIEQGVKGDSMRREAPFAGVPRSRNNAFPKDLTVGPCLEAYGGPRGGAFSYERGTPCIDHIARPRKHRLGAIGAVGALLNILRRPRKLAGCRDPLYRGAGCDPKGGMAFLQNNLRCPPMLGARRT